MFNLRTLHKAKENLCLQTFLWGVCLSFLFFIAWIIINGGYFFFYGDFNVQQIPFYQMIHDSILSGNIGWSYTTDLGANIIGSYSFYMIGSPFFWLTMIFPSQAVPYLMAPLLMIKFGLAAMAAYLFLRRYVREQRYAMIGGLLYAFSGFGIYNIFFNHFHEAMITFPFMLAAMDAFIYEKRKGVLAASVFAAALVNYYFFAGQAVFIFIYWCFRMVTRSYRLKLTEFLRFVLEIIVGFLCAGVILVPSIFAVLQNSRLDNFPHGWGALVYSSEQRYLHIILSFFFPPDMPAYANFTPDSNAKWGSVAGWLPMFSMVGVFAFYQLKTHKWLRKLIPTLFVMALVPVLNCSFQLFNSTYYARWFYMLTLMLTLATVICLDHEETDYKPALVKTFVITGAITALIGLMPVESPTDKDWNHEIGLEKYPDRFWAWCGLAILALVTLATVLCMRKNPKVFKRWLSISLSATIVIYANVLIGVGVLNAGYKREYIKDYVIDNREVFNGELKDIKSVRTDFYNVMDNVGMFWQVPTIQAFQSIVPGSVMDFYKSVGVERSVASRPETEVYGIRGLLSVKYLFDYDGDSKSFEGSSGTMEMPGWKKLMSENHFDVYENEYYIPYGFTYDEYITEDQYELVSESNRHLLLLKSIVLTDEQAKKYSDILEHHKDITDYTYNIESYYHDCNDRKKLTCESIDFENNQFTARFTAGSSDELVFFSIPYEEGWSAEVNGEPVGIEKVNVGFMAVRVPADRTSDIVFTYRTPGLVLGAVVSGTGIVLFVVYMLLWKSPSRRKSIIMNYYEDDEEFVPSDYDDILFEEYKEDSSLTSYSYAKTEKELSEQTAAPPDKNTEINEQSNSEKNTRQKIDNNS